MKCPHCHKQIEKPVKDTSTAAEQRRRRKPFYRDQAARDQAARELVGRRLSGSDK